MQISTKTKLDIASYMSSNFKHKGSAGYIYIKKLLEYLLEEYKQEGTIKTTKISVLLKEADLKTSYQNCQRAIRYFIDAEKFEGNASDFLIDTLEKIISNDDAQVLHDKEVF